MQMADNLTHADFSKVRQGTVCERHCPPTPLAEVLDTSLSYASHTMGMLRKKVKNHLRLLVPDIVFPI